MGRKKDGGGKERMRRKEKRFRENEKEAEGGS